MGNATLFYDELRFDTRDPDVTHVYVFLRGEGDCPHFVHGWHHKAFPATVNPLQIQTMLWEGVEIPLHWEREAPQAQPLVSIFNPHEYVPVRAEELLEWRTCAIGVGPLTSIDVADAITGRLSMAPDWHKACPYCRAHDMMLQAQRNPPQ